jgi:hypothetical protein
MRAADDLCRVHRARPRHADRDLPPARQAGLRLGGGGGGPDDPAARPHPQDRPGAELSLLWEIPDLARLDAWEDYFHSPAALANTRSLAMHRAIHIQRAGIYDVLHRADPLGAPLHAVEYVDPLDQPEEVLRAAFADRARRHGSLRQVLLLRRIGLAGPEPALLCFWALPSHAAAEALLRDAPLPGTSLADVGLYRPFGDETL